MLLAETSVGDGRSPPERESIMMQPSVRTTPDQKVPDRKLPQLPLARESKACCDGSCGCGCGLPISRQ